MRRTVVIIPARWNSSRFPGKPLTLINGVSLIRRTYAVAHAKGFETHVATDDTRVAAEVIGFGGKVIPTDSRCRNGTERCAEAAELLGLQAEDIVVNLQGDSPCVPGEALWRLVDAVKVRGRPGTVVQPRTGPRGGGEVSVALSNNGMECLYFSRAPVPWGSPTWTGHVGVYGFPVGWLRIYASLPLTFIEASEQLEQLRWLERPAGGMMVGCRLDEGVKVPEVNFPADVIAVEAVLRDRQC